MISASNCSLIAKRIPSGQVDIFSGVPPTLIRHPEFSKVVLGLGKVVKGKTDGRMMQIEIVNKYGGAKTVNLDLFIPQPHDYWRQFVIRTGSSTYSHDTIANAWLKKGWVGTEDGLRLQEQCVGSKNPEGKVKWRCIVENPELPPVWNSEQEFFDWLGIKMIHPKLRTI